MGGGVGALINGFGEGWRKSAAHRPEMASSQKYSVASSRVCSTHQNKKTAWNQAVSYGAEGEIRTPDLLITSEQVLRPFKSLLVSKVPIL